MKKLSILLLMPFALVGAKALAMEPEERRPIDKRVFNPNYRPEAKAATSGRATRPVAPAVQPANITGSASVSQVGNILRTERTAQPSSYLGLLPADLRPQLLGHVAARKEQTQEARDFIASTNTATRARIESILGTMPLELASDAQKLEVFKAVLADKIKEYHDRRLDQAGPSWVMTYLNLGKWLKTGLFAGIAKDPQAMGQIVELITSGERGETPERVVKLLDLQSSG